MADTTDWAQAIHAVIEDVRSCRSTLFTVAAHLRYVCGGSSIAFLDLEHVTKILGDDVEKLEKAVLSKLDADSVFASHMSAGW